MITSRRFQRQSAAGRTRGHAGIGQDFDLLVRTDHFVHRRQLDRAIEAAGRDHGIGFRQIEKQRAVAAFFAAMFIGHQRGFDSVTLARLHRQHDVDESIAAADPGEQRSVGAKSFRQTRRILRADFFAMGGLETNALQDDAGEVESLFLCS